MNKKLKNIISNYDLYSVKIDEIVIGEIYNINDYDTKVIILHKDDSTNRAFVTKDLFNKKNGFFVDYDELKVFVKMFK